MRQWLKEEIGLAAVIRLIPSLLIAFALGWFVGCWFVCFNHQSGNLIYFISEIEWLIKPAKPTAVIVYLFFHQSITASWLKAAFSNNNHSFIFIYFSLIAVWRILIPIHSNFWIQKFSWIAEERIAGQLNPNCNCPNILSVFIN